MGFGLGRLYVAVLRVLPDRLSLGVQHRLRVGRWPNLKEPRTFNEKVQRRKLSDRDPRFPRLADKIEAKTFARERMGEAGVTPTIWHGSKLPPIAERTWKPPFVLKGAHGSGQNIIVKTQADLDWPSIDAKVAVWLAAPYASYAREWLYGQIPPRLLIEPIIGDGITSPVDYKFFVFGGRVEFIQVDSDRFTEHRRNFFDREWQEQAFGMLYAPAQPAPERPSCLLDMVKAAEDLGRDFDFVRVDLYDIDGKPRFGEMTFYPDSGLGRFSPPEADRVLGGLWRAKPGRG